MAPPLIRNRSLARARHAVLATLVLLAAHAVPARAVQIVVTTTEDEATNDGDCSLREAFHAASNNVVRDACVAGSNVSEDTIVLASDAVYSLTIPGSSPPGLAGALVVSNNTATDDLTVEVAGGGTATIRQDAVPDARILVVSVGAHLHLQDVVLEGGAVTGTDTGGGIFIGQTAELSLLRCAMRFNTAVGSGAAIRNNGGTLIVEDSLFESNVAGGSGGAISIGSNTFTLVKDSFFANNVALSQFGGGGAIESADQISIVGTTFVNNRAKSLGGAITHFHDVADEAAIVQSCFVGNEADFSGNAVDVFAGSVTLNAAGNWWGATSGPSGVGGGAGDGIGERIAFDPPSNVPLAECLPLELVANGGFQSDGDGDGIPERWFSSGLSPGDGRACNAEGACVVKMRGNGTGKQLSHVFRVEGGAGDTFTFRARSRAKDVPSGPGPYRALVTIFHDDGSTQTSSLNFSAGKHGFERLSREVTASEDYFKIRVQIDYRRAGGVVRFDSVSLVLSE
jgi:CSLREA domain-containing protein